MNVFPAFLYCLYLQITRTISSGRECDQVYPGTLVAFETGRGLSIANCWMARPCDEKIAITLHSINWNASAL
jgi:hypothetical protein